MRRSQLIVYGSVQGVFFRYSTKKEAKKLKLTGWCRNESDGTVLIEVQGDSEGIDKFITWARQGSPLARVEKIEISELDIDKEEEEFEIR